MMVRRAPRAQKRRDQESRREETARRRPAAARQDKRRGRTWRRRLAAGGWSAISSQRGGDRNHRQSVATGGRSAGSPPSPRSGSNSQHLTLTNTTWFAGGSRTGARCARWCVRSCQDGVPAMRGRTMHSRPASTPSRRARTLSTPGDPAQYMIGKLRLAAGAWPRQGREGAHCGHRLRHRRHAYRNSTASSWPPSIPWIRPEKPHTHGTAIAGAIAAQARLVGVAPRSHILAAIRPSAPPRTAPSAPRSRSSKSSNWAVAQGARVINMSFAGPASIRACSGKRWPRPMAKGIVLIAAAGNAGPKSPPLFPRRRSQRDRGDRHRCRRQAFPRLEPRPPYHARRSRRQIFSCRCRTAATISSRERRSRPRMSAASSR